MKFRKGYRETVESIEYHFTFIELAKPKIGDITYCW